MQTTLDKIWLEEFEGEKALRADFSNDRHHRVVIQRPHGNEQLAQALIDLALNIRRDQHLTPNAEVRGDRPLYGRASLSTDGLCSIVEAEK